MHRYVRRALQAALVVGGLLAAGVLALVGAEVWAVPAILVVLGVAAGLRGRADHGRHQAAGGLSFVPHQRGSSDRS